MLIDVFAADPEHGEVSREAIRRCRKQGSLVACEVVFAEVAAGFPSPEEASSALTQLEIDFSPLDPESALLAGEAFRAYRLRGGPRGRVVADFLVGAHAARQADRLLTRDRGFFGDLDRLAVVAPGDFS